MLSRLHPNLNIHGKAGSAEQLTKGQHDSMRYKTDLESLQIEERDFLAVLIIYEVVESKQLRRQTCLVLCRRKKRSRHSYVNF